MAAARLIVAGKEKPALGVGGLKVLQELRQYYALNREKIVNDWNEKARRLAGLIQC